MTTAVLDANVIVSGFPDHQGAPAALIDRWLARDFQLTVSDHILDGVVRAWNKPWFLRRFPYQDREQALRLIRAQADFVIPATGTQGVAPDYEDDLVLATAVAGNVAYLVTGDRRFRLIGQYENIAIRTPREFIAILDQGSPGF